MGLQNGLNCGCASKCRLALPGRLGKCANFLIDQKTGELVPLRESQPSEPETAVSRPLSEPERFIRLDIVMTITRLSRTTLWRMERLGTFPRRKKIGKRAVAWLESEGRDWLAGC
jgi:prophage regulatory protein